MAVTGFRAVEVGRISGSCSAAIRRIMVRMGVSRLQKWKSRLVRSVMCGARKFALEGCVGWRMEWMRVLSMRVRGEGEPG